MAGRRAHYRRADIGALTMEAVVKLLIISIIGRSQTLMPAGEQPAPEPWAASACGALRSLSGVFSASHLRRQPDEASIVAWRATHSASVARASGGANKLAIIIDSFF